MASHFECLGFPITPEDGAGSKVVEVVRRLFDRGRPAPAPEGFHAVRYASESGVGAFAALAVDGTESTLDLRCLAPTFTGSTRRRSKILRSLPDESCAFCDYLHVELRPEGADRGHPVLVEVKQEGLDRKRDVRGLDVVLAVTLLATKREVFADVAAFTAGRPEDLEAASFVPTGLLTRPHRPLARVTGTVAEVRTVVNPVSDRPFLHVRLATFGGEIDVAAAPGEGSAGIRAGALLLAEGPLLAQVVEGL